MLKKTFWLLMVILLAFSGFLVGCESSPEEVEPVEEDEAEVDEGEEETAADEVIVLKYNDYGSEALDTAKVAMWAAEEIEERSNGRVKIETFFGGTLIEHADTYHGLARGVADLSFITPSWSTGIHVLGTLPNFLNAEAPPSPMNVAKTWIELYEMYPQFQEELADTGTTWIAISSLNHYHLNTSDVEVRVPDDLRGLKINADGDAVDWVETLGATATRLPVGDWYMAHETGLIDGQFMHFPAMRGMKLYEVTNTHTMLGAYTPLCGVQANLDTWNSLPADVQELLSEVFQEAMFEIVRLNEPKDEDVMNTVTERGHTVIWLTPEEDALWRASMAEFNERWVEQAEAAGYPAREIIEARDRLYREYREEEDQ